jgi:branched-chain amino acid transport system permease protein
MSIPPRVVPLALMAALGVLPVLAAVADQPFWVTVATRIVILSVAAVSLDLVLGYAGLASFGHAAFFGLGGFTVGILSVYAEGAAPGSWLHLIGREASLSAIAAIAAASIFGALSGALALRTRGFHFVMITLAFSQMLYFLFISLPAYGGDEGLRMANRQLLFGFELSSPTAFYYLCFAVLCATVAVMRALVVSRFGRALLACKQNERRMKFLGVRTGGYLLVAFIISAAGTGLAGALMANHGRFVGPHMLSWFQSGELMLMLILGGTGSVYGGIAGAAIFVLLQEGMVDFSQYWEIFLGAALLAIVLASPGGVLRLVGAIGPRND